MSFLEWADEIRNGTFSETEDPPSENDKFVWSQLTLSNKLIISSLTVLSILILLFVPSCIIYYRRQKKISKNLATLESSLSVLKPIYSSSPQHCSGLLNQSTQPVQGSTGSSPQQPAPASSKPSFLATCKSALNVRLPKRPSEFFSAGMF